MSRVEENIEAHHYAKRRRKRKISPVKLKRMFGYVRKRGSHGLSWGWYFRARMAGKNMARSALRARGL